MVGAQYPCQQMTVDGCNLKEDSLNALAGSLLWSSGSISGQYFMFSIHFCHPATFS